MTVEEITNRERSSTVSPLHRISVGEAMHRGVFAVPLTAPLSEVVEVMAKHRVHCVVALGDDADRLGPRVWGIVSDVELMRVASTEDLRGRTAGGIATTEVVTVEPAETVHRAAELMTERGVSHVLVVDPLMDRPIGVLSTLDIAAALAETEPRPSAGAFHVTNLMTPSPLTVDPATPLKQVARLLSEHAISGVPVVENGEVVGVVSETDIVAKERAPVIKSGGLAKWFARIPRPAERERSEARIAGEVMTTPAITIESWRTAADAVTLMLDRDVQRLPVLKNGKLVGIVTRADLVSAFSRPDAEIEREIREEILLHSFWIPDGHVEITVRNGEVTVTGTVESELMTELLPAAIRRVPGVVGVRSKLRTATTPDQVPQFERLISPR